MVAYEMYIMKFIHVSLALELVRFYCHIRNMEFIIKPQSLLVILHCSLRDNDLTATAAIARATVLSLHYRRRSSYASLKKLLFV